MIESYSEDGKSKIRAGGLRRPALLLTWACRSFLALGCALLIAAGIPQQEGLLHSQMDEKIIRYMSNDDLADPVAKLQGKIDSGKATLAYEPARGYLQGVLDSLGIPVSSQTLVFSKTSSQAPHTSPETPRALYFNDSVYIGWVQGGDSIDLVGIDPKKGPIFYTLSQDMSKKPVFKRRESCMQCHIGPKTSYVPGLLVRSVITTETGRGLYDIDGFVSGHNNPLKDRWAGWYVTGKHAGDQHQGNVTVKDREDAKSIQLGPNSNITSLSDRLDTSKYLSPHSDTVALLVLDHVVRMQNHIVQANYETRLSIGQHGYIDPKTGKVHEGVSSRIARAGEALLSYMLFRDESPLNGRVEGTSKFTEEFSKNGPRDKKGRSLREFDLEKRLFRYPCSYLIHSESFDALPKEMKEYLWRRLDEVLRGRDNTATYRSMSPADRKAVFEILLDTKPEFRAWISKNA